MPHTNTSSQHERLSDADRSSYHPAEPSNWADPAPRTVQQGLDHLVKLTELPVVDSNDLVKGSVDSSKRMRIEVDGVAASTTRVLTMPDLDVDLGNDFAAANHSHAASEISSGILALARGGLNADATSFTNAQLLRLDSAGTAVESAGKRIDDLIEAALVDAKGDLLAGTSNDSVGRLAVGSNGYVLTADGSQSSGLAWAAGPSIIGARVYNAGDISCSSGAWTTLTFDSEKWDTDSIHSTSSNTGRLTCNTDGVYLVTCGMLAESGNLWNVALRFRYTPSGGTATTVAAHIKKSDTHYWELTTVYELHVGDFVTVEHFQDSGTSRNARRGGDYSVEFGMHMLATI